MNKAPRPIGRGALCLCRVSKKKCREKRKRTSFRMSYVVEMRGIEPLTS